MSIKLSTAYSMGKEKRGNQLTHIPIHVYNLILSKEAPIITNKDVINVPGPGIYSPSYKTTKGKINP